MRMKAVYCLLVLLAGCASAPKPSPYPYSSQEHMQAAHHWNELASEVAEEVTKSMVRGPIYIKHDDRSPFDQAFHGFLITELWNRGISVSPDPHETPLHLDWKVQRVVHNANRSNSTFPFGLGWLTGGVTALVTSPFVAVEPVFMNGSLPHSEVIVTTQLTDIETRAVPVRLSEVYYIHDRDWQHYDTIPPLVQKSYSVVNQ